jgi:predicted PurR-regulated permease PerM
MNKVSKSSTAIRFLAFTAGTALFYYGMEMAAPILLAILLFYLLDPLVSYLKKWKIPRIVSSLLLVFLFLVLFLAMGRGIYDGADKLTAEIPQYSEKLRGIAKSFTEKAASIQKNTEKLIPKAPTPKDTQKVQVVPTQTVSFGTVLFRGMNSVFSLVADLLLIPILAVFFLLEKKYLRTHFAHSLGAEFPLDRVSSEIASMVRAYFLGNLVVGGVTAIGFYIVFLVMGLENRILLALLAGFLNLIPIFGAFIGALLPAAQALLQFDHLSEALIILVASIVFHVVVNSVILPKMVGARINVNASAATVGLVFWGWLWGGVGLLLAIPLMALLRTALSTRPETLSWSNLIAENPEYSVFAPWRRTPPLDLRAP